MFIIRKDIEEEFKEVIGNRIQNYMDVEYVFQDINDLPEYSYIHPVSCITSCDGDNGRLYTIKQVFLFCEINSCFIYIYILDFFIMSFLFHLHSYYSSDSYDSMGYDLCTFHKEV